MKLLAIILVVAAMLLIVIALSIIMERYWRKQQEEIKNALDNNILNADLFNRIGKGIPDLTGKVPNLFQNVFQDNTAQEVLINQFREWITIELKHEPELRAWLLSVPDDGFNLLTTHIANFCEEMNMELVWLLEKKVDVAPILQESMKAMIVDYCWSCYKGIQVQRHAYLFDQYQKLIASMSTSSKNAPKLPDAQLTLVLFVELAEKGLITLPSPSKLLNITEEEQQQQALQLIQEAAAKDWQAFALILQNALASQNVDDDEAVMDAASMGNGRDVQAASTNNDAQNQSIETLLQRAEPPASVNQNGHTLPIIRLNTL
ncbi:MAG: hypothetical protein AAF639_28725 [Chloroflexota bacterium]